MECACNAEVLEEEFGEIVPTLGLQSISGKQIDAQNKSIASIACSYTGEIQS